MNIRIHLKRQWSDHAEATSSASGQKFSLFGRHVLGGQVTPFIDFSNHDVSSLRKFMDACAEVVDHITVIQHLPGSPHRIRGVYKYQSAIGELESQINDSARPSYRLFITSDWTHDALELLNLIRTGQILPDESWDKAQIAPLVKRPRRHLRERTRPRFRFGHRRSTA